MTDWPIRSISEVAEFQNAKRIPLSSIERAKRQGSYPYYGASGIVDHLDDYIFDGTFLLVSEDGENLRTRKTPIAFKATGQFWVNNHAHILSEREPGVLDFLEYAFSHFDISPYITGAVQPKLNKGSLEAVKLPIPHTAERLAINALLNSLTNKIESNRQMGETLEAMAQAIFRDWFVDFGPTRRKMEGETDPVAILGGLTPNPENAAPLAALLPATISNEGLPEGWEAGDLSAVAKLNPESWSARNHPKEVEYVDLANTKWGTIESTVRYVWSDAPSRARRIVRTGDTIVGTVRPGNGSYSYIGNDGLTASTGFAVLRPAQENWRTVVYCSATRSENIESLASLADGGAYPAVRPEVVLRSPFNFPGEPVLDGFGEILTPLFERMEHNKSENRTLADTLYLLLPKLMSGEIRLLDAEAVT